MGLGAGHDGPRLPIRSYHGSAGEGGASGALKRLRTDGVILLHGQIAGLGHTSSVPHLSAGGGGAADPGPSRHRSILRRDKESMDCDLPDSSNTELSTPLRHIRTIGDGPSIPADAMLVDQDERNPVMPLSSADCQVPIDQTPRNKRCPVTVDEDPGPPITSIPTGGSLQKKRGPKTKSHGWSKKGHGGHQRREFKCQGWQSGGPSSSDSPL